MRVEVRFERLRALHVGESTAEPYIWPVFFKVDSVHFADVLRGRLEKGTTTSEDLATRGISLEDLPEEAAAVSSSFHAPGGEHGNLPPMQSGEETDVDLSWTTTLEDDDTILRGGQAIIGAAAILFEEDLSPGHERVRLAYAEFVTAFQSRIRAAIARSIVGALPPPGPYPFDYRRPRQAAAPDRFDPIELERELTKKMPRVHPGVYIDKDDFIGAMVWCRSSAEMTEKPETLFTKLWTPTTGSEEGSWELDVSVRIDP